MTDKADRIVDENQDESDLQFLDELMFGGHNHQIDSTMMLLDLPCYEEDWKSSSDDMPLIPMNDQSRHVRLNNLPIQRFEKNPKDGEIVDKDDDDDDDEDDFKTLFPLTTMANNMKLAAIEASQDTISLGDKKRKVATTYLKDNGHGFRGGSNSSSSSSSSSSCSRMSKRKRLMLRMLKIATAAISSDSIDADDLDLDEMLDLTSKFISEPSSSMSTYKGRECNNCKTRETPLWRRDSLNPQVTLCNACALYAKNHNGSPRPTLTK